MLLLSSGGFRSNGVLVEFKWKLWSAGRVLFNSGHCWVCVRAPLPRICHFNRIENNRWSLYSSVPRSWKLPSIGRSGLSETHEILDICPSVSDNLVWFIVISISSVLGLSDRHPMLRFRISGCKTPSRDSCSLLTAEMINGIRWKHYWSGFR
jgi:hypothetical protein